MKETEAKSFRVEVVNSWKNSGIKVSFMSDDEYVVIAISSRIGGFSTAC